MSVEFHDDQATPGASEYSWCTPLDTDFTRTIVPAGNTPRLNHALDVLGKVHRSTKFRARIAKDERNSIRTSQTAPESNPNPIRPTQTHPFMMP